LHKKQGVVMRFYETIYIVDPNLENMVLEKTMNQIQDELQKTKAKIINHREWGKKRLAYQIANQKYGSFMLLQFELNDLTAMEDFNTWLKLNNVVLRHMTVGLQEKPDKYVEKSLEIPENKNEDGKNASNDKIDDEVGLEDSNQEEISKAESNESTKESE
tara:strand:- start:47 stop:526 length:480 start_codon:yes stop_codon:yes gene_type:complete